MGDRTLSMLNAWTALAAAVLLGMEAPSAVFGLSLPWCVGIVVARLAPILPPPWHRNYAALSQMNDHRRALAYQTLFLAVWSVIGVAATVADVVYGALLEIHLPVGLRAGVWLMTVASAARLLRPQGPLWPWVTVTAIMACAVELTSVLGAR